MIRATTLGELRRTAWASRARRQRTVKDELRENLICLLENGSPLFPGIVGYEETVIPQLVNAILSRHNFILLGLRGQAKSRILRQLITLLDDEIPILAGSEVNDDPFEPISKYGRELIAERGDKTPIAWLAPQQRLVQKQRSPRGNRTAHILAHRRLPLFHVNHVLPPAFELQHCRALRQQ